MPELPDDFPTEKDGDWATWFIANPGDHRSTERKAQLMAKFQQIRKEERDKCKKENNDLRCRLDRALNPQFYV